MSSKLKLKQKQLIDENRKLRLERQRALRYLTAMWYQNDCKPLTVDWVAAHKVTGLEQLSIVQEGRTFKAFVTQPEAESGELGSESEGQQVQQREGNVGGPIQDDVASTDIVEVQLRDKYGPGEV
jgi:hypothetical protein